MSFQVGMTVTKTVQTLDSFTEVDAVVGRIDVNTDSIWLNDAQGNVDISMEYNLNGRAKHNFNLPMLNFIAKK